MKIWWDNLFKLMCPNHTTVFYIQHPSLYIYLYYKLLVIIYNKIFDKTYPFAHETPCTF